MFDLCFVDINVPVNFRTPEGDIYYFLKLLLVAVALGIANREEARGGKH